MNAALRELFLGVGLRDQMDDLRRAIGKPLAGPAPGTVCEDESAIVGDDGWLYVHAGGNQWHPQSVGALQLTPPGVERWAQLLGERERWMAARGIRYAHLFVPEKSCVLPEYHPDAVRFSAVRPVTQMLQHTGPAVLYPLDALRAAKTLAPTHYRTNSHWTWYGAYVAAAALWRQLGIDEAEMAPELVRRPIQHDLAVKFSGIADENFHELEVPRHVIFKNDAQVAGHVGRIKQLYNPAAKHAQRVLLCGDSYAYDHNLAAWFSQQFQQVFCAWQFGIGTPMVELTKPDIVITQLAERFAPRLPEDALT